MSRLPFVCLAILIVANARPAASSDMPAVTPPAGHPRLLLRPDDLVKVRASVDDPALAASWKELRRRAHLPSDYKPQPRYDLAVLRAAEATAFLAMVENDPGAKRRAIGLAFQLLGSAGPDPTLGYHERQEVGRCLFTVAEVYDWCHDAMTSEERRQLCRLLREHATIMEIKFPPVTPGAIAGHSSGAQLLYHQMSMAIATYDEDPEIYALVAGRFYREFVAPREFIYPGHAHHQGTAYGFGRFSGEAWAALQLTRMGAPAPWSLSAMGQVPYFYIYLRRPDGGMIKDGDDYYGSTRPTGSYWAGPTQTWMLFAGLFHDPQFASQWRRQLREVETRFTYLDDPAAPVFTILFRPDMIPDAELSALPLTRYFPEPFGAMIARTGWNVAPNSGDVVAYMKIGTHRFDNHQHADSGQFQLYYRGSLAIDSGFYAGYGSAHFQNYFRRAVAHNTLLIEEPSETFAAEGEPLVNDGGQRMLDMPFTMEEFWEEPTRTAKVLAHYIGPDPTAPEVSLIKGDLTQAYSDIKARRVSRTMAFLPLDRAGTPAAFVVLDRVESVRADQRKVSLLHTMEEPRIDGNQTTVQRTGEQVQVLRWAPASIIRDSETADTATLSFDLEPLAGRRIWKAELSCRTPWSRAGDLLLFAGDQRVATVKMDTVNPIPLPVVTSWIQAALKTTATPAALTVKRVGGDSRGVLGPVEGPHAPHLRIWVETEPYAGKLVQTTLLPESQHLELRKIGGPDKEFMAGGKNWPDTVPNPEPMGGHEAGAWRIEVGDTSGSRATTFLNVHQVMDAETPPAPVRLVKGNGIIGAAVAGRMFLASATTEWVAEGSTIEIEAGDIGPDGQVLTVLTDLSPGDHSLWQGDALIAAMAVEAPGHTFVVSLRPGVYQLKSR